MFHKLVFIFQHVSLICLVFLGLGFCASLFLETAWFINSKPALAKVDHIEEVSRDEPVHREYSGKPYVKHIIYVQGEGESGDQDKYVVEWPQGELSVQEVIPVRIGKNRSIRYNSVPGIFSVSIPVGILVCFCALVWVVCRRLEQWRR